MKNIVMEHFRIIFFQKCGPANNQHTYQSINQQNWVSDNDFNKIRSFQFNVKEHYKY